MCGYDRHQSTGRPTSFPGFFISRPPSPETEVTRAKNCIKCLKTLDTLANTTLTAFQRPPPSSLPTISTFSCPPTVLTLSSQPRSGILVAHSFSLSIQHPTEQCFDVHTYRTRKRLRRTKCWRSGTAVNSLLERILRIYENLCKYYCYEIVSVSSC